MSYSNNIKVAIRLKPNNKSQWVNDGTSIYQIESQRDPYAFDHIFGMEKTTREIYDSVVKEFVESFVSGINSTVFAYGQTSSGKTFTMLGDADSPGLMTLAIDELFAMTAAMETQVLVSYLEIYNEVINDLLDTSRKNLKISTSLEGTFYVKNLTENSVTTKAEMCNLLQLGDKNRQIGDTKMNDKSSRSHTIFKVTLKTINVDKSFRESVINFVDLAGSERAAQTKSTGDRLKEGGYINKSLSTLGNVIRQLSETSIGFVSFRDSKLTQLLQQSLGGNTRTLIIATITVTLRSVYESHSTLKFAQRAKSIQNKPRVNEVKSMDALHRIIAELTARNLELEANLEGNGRKFDVDDDYGSSTGISPVSSGRQSPAPMNEQTTPLPILRSRLSKIQQSYDELSVFTKNEHEIEVEQVERLSLKIAELTDIVGKKDEEMFKLKETHHSEIELLQSNFKDRYKLRETELLEKIKDLESAKNYQQTRCPDFSREQISAGLLELEKVLKKDTSSNVIQELNQQIVDLQSELDVIKSSRESQNEKLVELEFAVTQYCDHITEKNKAIDTLSATNSKLQSKLEDVLKTNDEDDNELRHLLKITGRPILTCSRDILQAELQEVLGEYRDLRTKCEQSKSKTIELEAAVANLSLAHQNCEHEKTILKDKQEELTNKIKDLRHGKNILIENNARAEELQGKILCQEATLKKLQEELSDLSAIHQNCEAEKATLMNKQEELTNKIQEFDHSARVQTENNARILCQDATLKKLRQELRDLSVAHQNCERERAMLMDKQEKLTNEIQELEHSARVLTESSARAEELQARILRREATIEQLQQKLRDLSVAHQNTEGERAILMDNQEKLTNEIQALKHSARVLTESNASAEELQARILRREATIEQLQQKLRDLSVAHQNTEGERAILMDNQEKLTNEIQALKHSARVLAESNASAEELQARILRREATIEQLQQKLRDLSVAHQNTEGERAILMDNQEKLTNEIQALKHSARVLAESNASAEELQARILRREATIEQLQQKLRDLSVAHQNSEGERAILMDNQEKLTNEIQALKHSARVLAESNASAEELQARILRREATIEQLQQKLRDLSVAHQNSEGERAILMDNQEKLTNEIQALKHSARVLAESNASAEELQARILRREATIEQLQQKLRDLSVAHQNSEGERAILMDNQEKLTNEIQALKHSARVQAESSARAEELQARILRREATIKQLQQKLRDLSVAHQNCEGDKASLIVEREELTNKMKEFEHSEKVTMKRNAINENILKQLLIDFGRDISQCSQNTLSLELQNIVKDYNKIKLELEQLSLTNFQEITRVKQSYDQKMSSLQQDFHNLKANHEKTLQCLEREKLNSSKAIEIEANRNRDKLKSKDDAIKELTALSKELESKLNIVQQYDHKSELDLIKQRENKLQNKVTELGSIIATKDDIKAQDMKISSSDEDVEDMETLKLDLKTKEREYRELICRFHDEKRKCSDLIKNLQEANEELSDLKTAYKDLKDKKPPTYSLGVAMYNSYEDRIKKFEAQISEMLVEKQALEKRNNLLTRKCLDYRENYPKVIEDNKQLRSLLHDYGVILSNNKNNNN